MNSTTKKDFGPIRDDYAFFLDHSTEMTADLEAYVPHVESLATGDGPVRMLDFGCGDGAFTERFLKRTGLASDRLELSLVEPCGDYLRQAVERLSSLTAQAVAAEPAIPAPWNARFDLVLSNHVLYYVPDLGESLAAIARVLAPAGLLLAAIAGQGNAIIQFWHECFARLGKPIPYNIAEDVERALMRVPFSYQKEDVQYDLVFPDTEENRLRISRFVLGSHFSEVPREVVLELFTPYVNAGNIAMRITHKHFVARPGK
jgi:SAM-dependent methyltransferase